MLLPLLQVFCHGSYLSADAGAETCGDCWQLWLSNDSDLWEECLLLSHHLLPFSMTKLDGFLWNHKALQDSPFSFTCFVFSVSFNSLFSFELFPLLLMGFLLFLGLPSLPLTLALIHANKSGFFHAGIKPSIEVSRILLVWVFSLLICIKMFL